MSRVLNRQRVSVAGCCVLLSITTVAPAIAQDAEQKWETESARELDRITVVAEKTQVATKTDTELSKIPQAVSVVSADLARSRGADTLQDTLRYTAGVTAEPYGLDPRSDGFFVRGLDAQQTLDGFRRLYTYSPLPRVDVYALDRVEVLRGPASVLYGQGTTGGLVNAVSKRPSLRDAAEMSVRAGSFDHGEIRMDMTGGLGADDQFAARLVTVAREAELPTYGLPNNRLLIAPSLTWFLGDATRLTWMGNFQRDDCASVQQFLPYAAAKGLNGEKLDDVRLFIGDLAHDGLDARQNTNTLLFEHDLAERWSLSTKLRDSRGHTDFVQIYADSFSNPADPFIVGAPGRTVHRYYYRTRPNVYSQQLDAGIQGALDTGPVKHALLFGVDYARYKQDSRSSSATSNVAPGQLQYITPIDIDNPVSVDVIAPPLADDPDQRSRQLGVYAQDQMSIGEKLTWVVGGRHDKVATVTEGSPEVRLSETTWRTGLVYEIAPGVSPYINYSESFTPVQGVDVYGKAFEPLLGQQKEIGVKWIPSRNFSLSMAAFRMQEDNRVTNDPDNISNVVQTGRVRSQGGEVEALYDGSNGWTVTGAASFTDVEVVESNYAYEKGRQLNDVPQWLGSLWVDKRIKLGAGALSIGAGARYVGETTSYGANATVRSADYTLFDLRAAYAQGPYFVGLNVNNIADRQVFSPCRALGDCFTGMPRTVMAEFGLRY